MTNASWMPKEKMTERQIVQTLLIMVDALKRAASKDISGLVARAGEETTWDKWEQCGAWLREVLQELQRNA